MFLKSKEIDAGKVYCWVQSTVNVLEILLPPMRKVMGITGMMVRRRRMVGGLVINVGKGMVEMMGGVINLEVGVMVTMTSA